ncbi:MAG: S24/S26 family peptidase [Thermoguttaceae bacterium]|nr:S24/S26 family peptidase [Thermoguttaceae bacterium]
MTPSEENFDSRETALLPGAALFELVREKFERDPSPDARVSFAITGRSMLPTLRDRIDVVYAGKPDRVGKYDVAIYRRDNGAYVVHRVARLERDGTFSFCGDNQTILERGIRRDQILGKVVAFQRGSRLVDCDRNVPYKLFVRFWLAIRPLRRAWRKVKRTLGNVLRKRANVENRDLDIL